MAKKVLLGMSGGVDSSVSAKLLIDAGYEVAGVTLFLHGDDNDKDNSSCGSSKDIQDARLLCEKLGIKHFVFDFRKEFEAFVLKNFIDEYITGNTPNPCIVCNKYIKFGLMLEKALEMGYDFIATGHYAKAQFDEKSCRYLLKRPLDRLKDQTYVLYSLTQHQLSHTLFPLGNLTKTEVRKIAEENGFESAKKADSQDICFVPDGDYAKFIEQKSGFKSQSGNYVDINGKVLGNHKGVINYTIGQRKGLGIALGKPQFVISKSAKDNTVVLGDEVHLFEKSCFVKELNFISVEDIKDKMTVDCKIRYRHTEMPAKISKVNENLVKVTFLENQRAFTSGQAAVFYDDEIVVGGGTIILEKE